MWGIYYLSSHWNHDTVRVKNKTSAWLLKSVIMSKWSSLWYNILKKLKRKYTFKIFNIFRFKMGFGCHIKSSKFKIKWSVQIYDKIIPPQKKKQICNAYFCTIEQHVSQCYLNSLLITMLIIWSDFNSIQVALIPILQSQVCKIIS